MSQHYSDPRRAEDPHALPDLETFEITANTPLGECSLCIDADTGCDDTHRAEHSGWYYWTCFPGCLPDSDPVGPFDSEAAALADAREGMDDAS